MKIIMYKDETKAFNKLLSAIDPELKDKVHESIAKSPMVFADDSDPECTQYIVNNDYVTSMLKSLAEDMGVISPMCKALYGMVRGAVKHLSDAAVESYKRTLKAKESPKDTNKSVVNENKIKE